MELEEFKKKLETIEKRLAKALKDRKSLLEKCPHEFVRKEI